LYWDRLTTKRRRIVKDFVVAFTGHRPTRLGGYRPGEDSPVARNVRTVLDHVVRRIIAAHPEGVTFLSGMAQGVDTWAAEIVIAQRLAGARAAHLIAVVPVEGHEERLWPQAAQERYRTILARADEVVVLQRPSGVPTRGQATGWLHARNRWMVDRADLLVAVFDGSPGGTAETVSYAHRRGVPVVRIDPAAVRTLEPAELAQFAQQLTIP
jgi:uncharacterized phage-like protein YoqJ